MKNIIRMSVLIVFVLAAGNLAAQPFSHDMGKSQGKCPKFGQRGGMMIEKLNLTEDQQSKFEKLRSDHQKQIGALKDDLDRLKIDRRTMMREDNIKRDTYLDLEKRMADIRSQIALSGAKFRMDVLDILTKEQRDQLKEMKIMGKRERGGAFFRHRKGFDN